MGGGLQWTVTVATIITQPSIGLQGHKMPGIWSSSQFPKLPFQSLEYCVFSSQDSTSHLASIDWILDSRAIDHMVHSLQFFTSIISIVQISVRLPNGEMAKVTHIGIV